jgi:hypothetical protein
MVLFTEKTRTRVAPKRPGENEFAFYDETNWAALETYRQLLNRWVAELPHSEQAELIARLRKGDTLGYEAALAELTIHAVLVRLGYKVELHPKSGHPSHRPDFLVLNEKGDRLAFIEVTTFGPADGDVAQSNREATIYNAIDGVKLPPGFRLLFDVATPGTAVPKIGKLCTEVEAWAEKHANDAVNLDEDPPARVFEAGDWQIELKLIGGYNKDRPAMRAIGGAMGDLRHVTPEVEIREALQKKGSRYGKLDAPYLIVVADCKSELQGGEYNSEALVDAVSGTQITTVSMPSGEVAQGRKSNGYWWHGGKQVHKNVSAVLLFPKPHLWALRDDRWQPLLIQHPSATRPLPDGLLGISCYRHDAKRDEWVKHNGKMLADILDLPQPWPPEGT